MLISDSKMEAENALPSRVNGLLLLLFLVSAADEVVGTNVRT